MAVASRQSPRVLIVRRDNIGDLVCTTPLIDALRGRFPQGRIAAAVNTYNAEVLARNPAPDAVFAYEKLKHRTRALVPYLLERMRVSAALRAERFDCVLVPAATPQALRLARAVRAGRVIAPEPAAGNARHEVERTFELGRELGVEGAPGPMRVFPDAERTAQLAKELGNGPFAAVHISARRQAQRWPLERYVRLIAELSSERKVMLLWAPGARSDPRHPGDDEAAARIVADCAGSGVVPVATADLGSLISALSLAGLVVCPDGGAMHLAAALGKRVVALFGDSPVERWRPWGVPHRVVRPESNDLADLPLEPVLEACRALA